MNSKPVNISDLLDNPERTSELAAELVVDESVASLTDDDLKPVAGGCVHNPGKCGA